MSAEQIEIPIPEQPRRVTLGRARAIRNELEKYLAEERPQYATDITAVAMRFEGADQTYRKIRHDFYRRRRLDELPGFVRVLATIPLSEQAWLNSYGEGIM